MAKAEAAIVDRRTVMKGAAALGVASTVTLGGADRANASSVTLDPTPGQGVANRAALQAAINTTPEGEMLALPAGTFEIDISGGTITIPKSITVAAGGETTLDVLPKTTTTMNSLFTVPSTVAKGHFRFENFRIEGPTSTSGGGSAIEWIRNGAVGSVSAFLLSVTGQFQYGIRRSGVGLLEVVSCWINARGSAVVAQDNSSSGGPSRLVVLGGELSGKGATTGSYGIDIQPHIALQCAGTRFDTFELLAIRVTSAAPTSIPSWTVSDCEVIDAALASTGVDVPAVFIRIVQRVAPSRISRQAPLRGPATFLDCDLAGGGSFTLVGNGNPNVRFLTSWLEPKGPMLAGSTLPARVAFDGCTWRLAGDGRALNLASSFTGVVRVRRSTVHDAGVTTTFAVSGGTVDFTGSTIDSPLTGGGLPSSSSATITNPPTLTNTGVHPASHL